jgi:two-component system sensor histidine kinase UhpB
MKTVPPPPRPFDLFDSPFGAVLRAALEAIVMFDERQTVVAANAAAQRMFGCSAEQMLGQSIDHFIPARHRAAHAAHVQRFEASHRVELSLAARRGVTALRFDGVEFPVEIAVSHVDAAGPGGSTHYHAALLRDVSQERALEEELDALQRRLRAVLELAPIAVWIADGDQVVFANRAAGRLFGAESGEALLGRTIYDLLRPQSHSALRQRVSQALAGESDLALVQGRLVRDDGQPREVEIALVALPDHGRTTVQMVITDITQRISEAVDGERSRQLLRQLSASVVEAREEERRRIARELHDELGQRLTALKMDLSSLATTTGLGPRDPRLAGMLAMLDDTVASVRRIASDLRPLMLDDLGLNAAIEWLASEASRRLGMAIEVHFDDVEHQLDGRVAIALYRMVQEALTNVARHAAASEVRIALRRRAGELVLTVQDNGKGFPAQALQREGSYGLMGIRERAHMLGGRIEIDNPADGGGRLSIHLPLAPIATTPAPSNGT